VTEPEFRRARSAEAKQQREETILEAARRLGEARGIRQVTLTDIADEVGMHKSAMLRYFETREQIFLRLTASGWHDWSAALRASLGELPPGAPPAAVAGAFADSLVARPMFCDLLAQAPLNLERNVSLESVRAFKLVTLEEVGAIGAELRRIHGLTEQQGIDVIATATGLAGAFWQMATPGPDVQQLYRSDPRLAHAIVDVGPRLARVLTGLLAGFLLTGTDGAGRERRDDPFGIRDLRGCRRRYVRTRSIVNDHGLYRAFRALMREEAVLVR
jgi:AcrR family transcriptional regulator